MSTLDLSIHVRHIDGDEEAKRILHAVDEAVTEVIGRPPNSLTHKVTDDFEAPARSDEEREKAISEGRR